MVKSETCRDVETFLNSHQLRTEVGYRREMVENASLISCYFNVFVASGSGGIGAKIELCQKYSTTRKILNDTTRLMSDLSIPLLQYTCFSNHKCSGNSENLKNLFPVRTHVNTQFAKLSVSLRDVFAVNCLQKRKKPIQYIDVQFAKILNNDKNNRIATATT